MLAFLQVLVKLAKKFVDILLINICNNFITGHLMRRLTLLSWNCLFWLINFIIFGYNCIIWLCIIWICDFIKRIISLCRIPTISLYHVLISFHLLLGLILSSRFAPPFFQNTLCTRYLVPWLLIHGLHNWIYVSWRNVFTCFLKHVVICLLQQVVQDALVHF
jgi:hypothetical protein